MRGKDVYNEGECLIGRITPACAGKSLRLYSFMVMPWDHPRVCGEKSLADKRF